MFFRLSKGTTHVQLLASCKTDTVSRNHNDHEGRHMEFRYESGQKFNLYLDVGREMAQSKGV